jgi:hypothetical protein
MIRLGWLLVLAAGCGLTAVQIKDRERCYARAEAHAQERVDDECPDTFRTCIKANDILEELRKAQEACP